MTTLHRILASLTLFAASASAQIVEKWVTRYNGPANRGDEGRAVVVDSAGDVIMAGRSDGSLFNSDFYTAKYSGADGSLIWETRYDGPDANDDGAVAVAVDAAGDVVVAGSSFTLATGYDYYTAKYSGVDGSFMWERRYDGPGAAEDLLTGMALDGAGDVIVSGRSVGVGTDADFYTAKYAGATGAIVWERRYDNILQFDGANAMAVDAAGDVYVTGSSFGPNGMGEDLDVFTAKYAAATGAVIWDRRYSAGMGFNASGRSIAADAAGCAIQASVPIPDGFVVYIARYAAADGAITWEKTLAGPHDRAIFGGTALDAAGNVLMTGSVDILGGESIVTDLYAAKLAAGNGATLWERFIDGPGASHDTGFTIVAVPGGDALVAGMSKGEFGSPDYYTTRFAGADGATVWAKRYHNFGEDTPLGQQAVAITPDGGAVVTGFSQGVFRDAVTVKYAPDLFTEAPTLDAPATGTTSGHPLTVAFTLPEIALPGSVTITFTGAAMRTLTMASAVEFGGSYVISLSTVNLAAAPEVASVSGGATLPDGTYTVTLSYRDEVGNVAATALSTGVVIETSDTLFAQWEKIYDGPGASDDSATGTVADVAGNVFVTGWSYNGDGNADIYTAKYAPVTGTLIWEHRYDSSLDDRAYTIALGADGNIAVAGDSFTGAGFDIRVIKYNGADGTQIWNRAYDGPAASDDRAHSVACDAAGNVIVTGYSLSAVNPDIYTAKYAAADGALVWEKRFTTASVDFLGEIAFGVALDAAGNVLITGYTTGATGNADIYTAKYAAADGALVWDVTFNGASDGEDLARKIVTDAAGNAIVTGLTYNGLDYDMITVKYAAADGALVWQKIYNGGSDDTGYGAAVDGGGDVFVTGATFTGVNSDTYTAKYAAADGAVIWSDVFSQPAGASLGYSISLDAAGNPVIGGETYNGVNFDLLAFKYTGADGTLQWSQSYNSPANRDDSAVFGWTLPQTVAATPDGGAILVGASQNAVGNYDFAVAKLGRAIELWRVAQFSAGADSPAIAGDLADPDADGISNVLEYALGSLPLATSLQPTASSFNYGDGPRLRILVPRDPAANDITLAVEAAPGPSGPWAAIATSTGGEPFSGPGYFGGDSATPGLKTVEIRALAPISAAPAGFLRVRASR